MEYQETKEFIHKQLKNSNINKELASKFMDILTWIHKDEEMRNNNFSKLTAEQLYEVGMRLHKKFQSSLETKVKLNNSLIIEEM
jgi:hypothetical protein